MLDEEVIVAFRDRAGKAGAGYRTLCDAALQDAMAGPKEQPLTAAPLRRVLREELHSA